MSCFSVMRDLRSPGNQPAANEWYVGLYEDYRVVENDYKDGLMRSSLLIEVSKCSYYDPCLIFLQLYKYLFLGYRGGVRKQRGGKDGGRRYLGIYSIAYTATLVSLNKLFYYLLPSPPAPLYSLLILSCRRRFSVGGRVCKLCRLFDSP